MLPLEYHPLPLHQGGPQTYEAELGTKLIKAGHPQFLRTDR